MRGSIAVFSPARSGHPVSHCLVVPRPLTVPEHRSPPRADRFERGCSSVALSLTPGRDGVSLLCGATQVLFDITMDIPDRRVTGLIGRSVCCKSTLLRCFNRMKDLIDDALVTGRGHLPGRYGRDRGSTRVGPDGVLLARPHDRVG
jgi:hypothetical protein